MVHVQCLDHKRIPLTQTASSTYAGKLGPVTGRQALADILTDAVSISQFEVLPKIDISFPYPENMSLQLSTIEL